MQNVLRYNLMADLPPDRLNHLGLGLNWLHSKTTMVRTKKNDSSFVFEWTYMAAKQNISDEDKESVRWLNVQNKEEGSYSVHVAQKLEQKIWFVFNSWWRRRLTRTLRVKEKAQVSKSSTRCLSTQTVFTTLLATIMTNFICWALLSTIQINQQVQVCVHYLYSRSTLFFSISSAYHLKCVILINIKQCC